MLIPLPRDSVLMVPDRAPVTPFVRRALALQRECPDMVQDAVRFLERYLHDGSYSRHKPLVMDRFLQQLGHEHRTVIQDVA